MPNHCGNTSTGSCLRQPDRHVRNDGHLHLTEEYIENHVANAIGLFLLRSTMKDGVS